ncbi:ABC transporter G family member 34-like isoform X2 [Cucumis melo var. makuwa]|nr:ABC transporter G family member 34-like isoform X2 [Cucumis melo var. makuwa]
MATSRIASSIREAWETPSESFPRSRRMEEEEEELRWAAIERLPTYERMRKGIIRHVRENGRVVEEVMDVTAMGFMERKELMERMVKVVEEDNEKFLRRMRERTDR